MRSVVIEGLVIGLLASVIGLFAGFGVAKLLSAVGGELPEAGMVFEPPRVRWRLGGWSSHPFACVTSRSTAHVLASIGRLRVGSRRVR